MAVMEAKLFQVVALLEDIPERKLVRGQVGTIVEKLGSDTFEVEFSDNSGRTYASLALKSSQFLLLRHDLVAVGESF